MKLGHLGRYDACISLASIYGAIHMTSRDDVLTGTEWLDKSINNIFLQGGILYATFSPVHWHVQGK